MLAARAAIRSKSWRGLQAPLSRGLHGVQSSVPSSFLKVSEEVRDAVATGKPVVALETTIYTHGFPFPENIALAMLLESVVRANGGVPATIGVLGGVARVGMNAQEIVELASTVQDKSAMKVSRRDLGYICGMGLAGKSIHGGTTISGTMILSQLAGIKIFGTGGLGGVHRGGENSMDVSADLTELGRTPVTVISSGCKSFLDIPRTLEYLETEGVCVGTFADGREGPVDFPAFYTRESGFRSSRVIENEAEAAAIVYAQSQLPVSSGILFANPVPLEHSVPKAEIDHIIEEAIRLADLEGYKGSDNTPFVLSKIKELSGDKSVTANRALVESNVKRATRVAVELAKLEESDRGLSARQMPAIPNPSSQKETAKPAPVEKPTPAATPITQADVLVAGSLAIDLSCDYAPFSDQQTQSAPVSHTSNPAIIGQSLGGVGHNVALAASLVGSDVLFCSVVADDLTGRAALSSLEKEGLSPTGIQVLPMSSGSRTAQYVAVNDANKDLVVAMADMGIVELPEQELDFDGFWEPLLEKSKPKWVVLDANWRPDVLAKWATIAKKHGARIAFEPVSTAKSRRLFSRGSGADAAIGPAQTIPNNAISLACPNRLELASMYNAARDAQLFESPEWWSTIDSMGLSSSGSRERLVYITNAALVDEGLPQQSIQLLPFIPCIVTKLGGDGVLLTQLLPPGDVRLTDPDYAPYILARPSSTESAFGGVYMRLISPEAKLSAEDVVSVNGAGDTLLGVLVAGLAKSPKLPIENILSVAQEASRKTLISAGGVSQELATLRGQF